MGFTFETGSIEQNAAPDYAMLANRLDRALLQPADRSFRVVAVVEMVAVPSVAECIVLSSALRKHSEDIVRVFESSREGLGAPTDIEALIHSQSVDRLRAYWMSRIALWPRDRHSQH